MRKNRKKRIIISVTSDLATDQRVQKVARSLHEADFEVLLVGRWLKESLPVDFPYKVKRMHLIFNRKVWFYAEFNIRIFLLLVFSKADFYLANDTDTLLANFLASKIRKKTKLVFDAHEIFPEVPEIQHRLCVKKFWTKMEDWIFPHLTTSLTVNRSVAKYYQKKYGIEMRVVMNAPYFQRDTEVKQPKPTVPNNKKVIIYQGALNVGRGLEWAIEAMPYVSKDAILVIIGDGDIRKKLIQLVENKQLMSRVIFLGKKKPDELLRYTRVANVGLCLLENSGLNYYYSLPNRIFDYLYAHIPVLATDFPEIRKIVTDCNSGVLIDHYEPQYLAGIINQMLENKMDTTHFQMWAREFSWENEQEKMLELFLGYYRNWREYRKRKQKILKRRAVNSDSNI